MRVVKDHWSWRDVQVVSTDRHRDQVLLLCPAVGCERWHSLPENYNMSLGLLRSLAKRHVKEMHRG